MSLFTDQHLNIAGHKVPFALVGAAAAAIGLLVVLRARSSGQNVASAGTSSASPIDTSSAPFSPYATQADIGAAVSGLQSNLANVDIPAVDSLTQQVQALSSQVTALQNAKQQVPTTGPVTPATTPPPAPPSPQTDYLGVGWINAFTQANTSGTELASFRLQPGEAFTIVQQGITGNMSDTGTNLYDQISVPGKGTFYVLDSALKNSGYSTTPPPAPAPPPAAPKIGAGFHPQIR